MSKSKKTLHDDIITSINWGSVGQYLIRYNPDNVSISEVLQELQSQTEGTTVSIDNRELQCFPLTIEAQEKGRFSPKNQLAQTVYDSLPRKFTKTLLDQLYEKSEDGYLYLSKFAKNSKGIVIPILGTTYEAGNLRSFSRRGDKAGHFQLVAFPKRVDDSDFVGGYVDYFSTRIGVLFASKQGPVVSISKQFDE